MWPGIIAQGEIAGGTAGLSQEDRLIGPLALAELVRVLVDGAEHDGHVDLVQRLEHGAVLLRTLRGDEEEV